MNVILLLFQLVDVSSKRVLTRRFLVKNIPQQIASKLG
jgi:hypothetical protein